MEENRVPRLADLAVKAAFKYFLQMSGSDAYSSHEEKQEDIRNLFDCHLIGALGDRHR